MNSALNVYQKNQVQTNTPEKLVLMLYEGAIKFISKGIKAIEEKDIQEANNNLIRSQDIMLELMSGVNFEAGDIAKNLYALYEYMHHRLMQANLKKEKESAQEVLNMVRELRDAWSQMLKENKASNGNSKKKTISASG
ncbi:MAG: fliS [Clostridiales bacterium]|jgi:flagellar protein FliS|nr:fliS [Clostridiales bacterium]